MRTDNRQIRLTEQDLHFVVESAVKKIIRENMEDEGIGQFFTNVKNAASAWNGNRKIQNAIGKVKQDLENLNNLATNYGLNGLSTQIKAFNQHLDRLSGDSVDNKDYHRSNMWDLRTQQQRDQYNQLSAKKQATQDPNAVSNQNTGVIQNPKVATLQNKQNADLNDGGVDLLGMAKNNPQPTQATQGKRDVNPNITGTLPGTNGTNMHYVQPPSGEVTNNGGFNPYYGQTNLYANNITNK